MRPHDPTRHRLLAAWMATALLAACGGGVDGETPRSDAHETISIDTAGRLAVAESNAVTLRIHDLDSGTVEASHPMQHPPSAVYPSPGGRYAVVMQRLQDRVQFVDGGIYQEDHVDHLHDYKLASRAVGDVLSGARPTHCDRQAGVQAAVFMDGKAAAPVRNAGVRLFTDASIGAGHTVAALELSAPLHGLAEPVGNKLLAAARAGDAPDSLPTHLAQYQRSGTACTFVRQLPTRCNGMHGSFSSGSSTLVGCIEGVMLVRHPSPTTVVPLSRVTGAIPVMPTAAPWPAMAANGAKDELYLTDPLARQLVVIDGRTGAVVTRRDLGYVPSALAWLGITR